MSAAIVTGSASGIGAAVVKRLRGDGWDVLGVDVSDAADLQADLTTREGNRHAVDTALQRFGRLDAVIPNAGIQHVAPVAEFPEDRWDQIVALLLTSPFLLAKYAWQHLVESGSGRLVVIASVHGLVASPFKSAYVSAKHGVVGLVRTLALEGAEDGVTATALCPAYVRTPLVERLISDQATAHGISEEEVLERVILEPQAVKELIEPEEVEAVFAFLLGPEGRRFTGVALPMDLGWTAH